MPSTLFYKWVGFPYHGHWLLKPVAPDGLGLQIALTRGCPVDNTTDAIRLIVITSGTPMDFNTTPMGLPVVSERAADLLRRLAGSDVQLIRCRIDSVEADYYAANIIVRLDCIDRLRSQVIIPATESLRAMHGWVINPAKAGDHVIFRLDNEPTTIVISNALKDEIERQQLVGPGLVELDGEELKNVMPGFRPAGMSRKGRMRRGRN